MKKFEKLQATKLTVFYILSVVFFFLLGHFLVFLLPFFQILVLTLAITINLNLFNIFMREHNFGFNTATIIMVSSYFSLSPSFLFDDFNKNKWIFIISLLIGSAASYLMEIKRCNKGFSKNKNSGIKIKNHKI